MILRGLPGSGKSHIAKRIREVEGEQGGEPPRIHSLDDYFVTVSFPACLCVAEEADGRARHRVSSHTWKQQTDESPSRHLILIQK